MAGVDYNNNPLQAASSSLQDWLRNNNSKRNKLNTHQARLLRIMDSSLSRLNTSTQLDTANSPNLGMGNSQLVVLVRWQINSGRWEWVVKNRFNSSPLIFSLPLLSHASCNDPHQKFGSRPTRVYRPRL